MDWRDRIKILWIDHAMWARHYIGSVILGLRDFNPVALRTFRNSKDLAELYGSFYGPTAVAQIESLLNQDILIVSEIASTMRINGDVEPLKTYWRQNKDALIEIASANPQVNTVALNEAFDMKFQLELELIKNLIDEDYTQSIEKYDTLRDNALTIANIIIDAVSKQFQA